MLHQQLKKLNQVVNSKKKVLKTIVYRTKQKNLTNPCIEWIPNREWKKIYYSRTRTNASWVNWKENPFNLEMYVKDDVGWNLKFNKKIRILNFIKISFKQY